jgi:hypothetical protein
LVVNDPYLAQSQDTVFIDFYMSHLKAGSAAADSVRRANDCAILRAHIDSFPARNSVLGGDLNFYSNTEEAYQILTSGVHPFSDPANMEGDRDGKCDFRTVHSQSSREPGAPNYDCGFSGGADSRFYFLLVSPPVQNGTMNVSYVDSSYSPLGNDGSIFNEAINDPLNTSGLPIDVLNAMYFMSDHLPIVMDLKVSLPQLSCIPDLVVNANPIAEGTYHAQQTILSAGTVLPGDTVVFKAGQNISLDPEFEVKLGAQFEAIIENCP